MASFSTVAPFTSRLTSSKTCFFHGLFKKTHQGPVPLCSKRAEVNSVPLLWWIDRINHVTDTQGSSHLSNVVFFFPNAVFGPPMMALRLQSCVPPLSSHTLSQFFLSHVIEWINAWRQVLFFCFCFFWQDKTWRVRKGRKEGQVEEGMGD